MTKCPVCFAKINIATRSCYPCWQHLSKVWIKLRFDDQAYDTTPNDYALKASLDMLRDEMIQCLICNTNIAHAYFCRACWAHLYPVIYPVTYHAILPGQEDIAGTVDYMMKIARESAKISRNDACSR